MFKKILIIALLLSSGFLVANEYFGWLKYNQNDVFDFRASKQITSSNIASPVVTLNTKKTSTEVTKTNTEIEKQNPEPLALFTPNVVYIDIFPKIINSGEFFKVEIKGNIADNTSVLFLNKTFPIFRNSTGNYSTFIGVPLSTEEGVYDISLSKNEINTTIYNNINSVQIFNKDRGFDYITLSNDVLSSSFSNDAVKRDAEIRSETSLMFSVSQYWDEPFSLPCNGEITTMFGVGRSYNNQPVSSYHLGLDIGADQFEKILAPAKGIIKRIDFSPLRGNLIYLDHGAGVQSSFAHLHSTLVSPGEIVEKGALLGLVGNSGASTGPHLHWEVSVWGVSTDPLSWTQGFSF